VAARRAGGQISLQFERLGRVVVDQEPIRPAAGRQGFQDRRDRSVATALCAYRPYSEPLAQFDQGIPYAIGLLGANPPDNFVFMPVQNEYIRLLFRFLPTPPMPEMS